MGIETVRGLGTSASEGANPEEFMRKYSRWVKRTICYILSAVTESPDEALLEGRQHMPHNCGNGG